MQIPWIVWNLLGIASILMLMDPSSSLPSGAARSMWAGKFHAIADSKRGDLHSSFADLKAYLSRFGYLRTAKYKNENLSAEFDDLLEEAIKLYQLNFNLPVTGTICNETMRLLHTPRCGREDVLEDGRPLMLRRPRQHGDSIELPIVTAPGSNDKFEGHWAVFAPSGKWQSTHNLTFAFSLDDTTSFLPADSARAAITSAFETWSSVIPVNFTEVTNFAEADIQIKFVDGDHGDGDPFDGRLGILAHSFPPEDGRFHFDSAEVWTTTDDLSTTGDEDAIDLETVALHEIGHLLGLAHTQVEGAVMYPSIALGQVKRDLTRDDVAGVQALYGAKYVRSRLPSPSCQELNSNQQ